MSGFLPLFQGWIRSRGLPLLGIACLVSAANAARVGAFDRVLEATLVAIALLLAQQSAHDCPNAVLHYFATLPKPRHRTIGAPTRIAAATVLAIGALVALHEVLGLGSLEVRAGHSLLGLGPATPYHHANPLWLNLIGLPWAAFWLHTGLVEGLARTPLPLVRNGGLPAEVSSVTLVALLFGGVVVAIHHLPHGPTREIVPGLIAGGIAAWAATRQQRRLDRAGVPFARTWS